MADKTVTYRLAANIAGFQAQMAQASASVKKFATDSTAANKEGAKFRDGLTSVGSAAAKVGVAAAAGLTAAVVVAARFDKAMSSVQAATGESAAGMEKLRAAAIKAGAETAFSASEAAAGIENLAKAGVSTQDILAGGLDGALALAAAGGIEVADAAEAAATAMTQFGLSGEQVPHIADLLAAAAGKAQGEVSDFSQALAQSGLVADQVGLSIEETTGGLAAFASAGLLGSDAGTSFKTMLGALTPNSAKAAAEMERLGLSAYDTQGNFVGLAQFAGNLRTALKGMTDQQRQATLETVFGSDAVRAASVLYEQGAGGVRKWITAVDDQGFAAETAATKLDNLNGDLEALGGALETALIGAGDGSQGILRGMVQGATDVVNAFNKLPPSAQNAASGLAAITAVTGGSLWLGAKTVQGIANTREALSNLGVQAGTTRTALAGIGKGLQLLAIVEGLKLLDNALDDIFNTQLDGSNLDRAMTALSQGRVEGTIFDTYGKSLDGFVTRLDVVNSKYEKVSGAFEDLFPGDSRIDEAEADLALLDERLASLVDGGNAKQAQAAFEQLAAAAVRQGYSIDEVRGHFEQYEIALRNAGLTTTAVGELFGRAGGTLTGLGKGLRGMLPELNATGDAFGDAADQGRDFAAVLQQLQGFLDKRAALRNYQAALDDFGKTLKENGRNFDRNTEKGRATEAALDEIASSALNVAENMKGANRVQFLRDTAKDIRAALGPMKNIPPAVQAIIDRLLKADRTDAKPKVEPQGVDKANADVDRTRGNIKDLDGTNARPTVELVGAGAAIGAAIGVRNAVLNIPKSASTTLTVNRVTNTVNNTVNRITRDVFNQADGGVLDRGARLHQSFAAGGFASIGAQPPQIRPYTGPAGITWSEEGSGPWEAFISGHPGKLNRSRQIAEEVVGRLGGTAMFANGGMYGSGGASGRGGALRIVGTLDTPFGPADVEGIAYDAAEDVYRGHKEMDDMERRAG